MSLPRATKDVSANPPLGSLTDPVDREQMHADVDRKLRFYGVIEAFRLGRMPDNTQIDETLRYVIGHSPVDIDKLSPQGHQLIEDSRRIIETAREIVQEKNKDELFQNFVWHTRGVEADLSRPGAPVTREQAREHAQQGAHHLRTLITLLFTNAETRKFLSDLTVIGRDLLARSVDQIRPTDEEIRGVDEPAASKQVMAGENKGVDEPSTSQAKSRESVDEPSTSQAKSRESVDDPSTSQAKSRESKTAVDAPSTSKQVKSREGKTAVDKPSTSKQAMSRENKTEATDAEAQKKTFKDRIMNIHRQHRSKVDDAKAFLKDEYFHQERRDMFIHRAKKVVLECQKNDDYNKSVTWLLDSISEYTGHAKSTVKEGKRSAKGVWDDPNLRQAKNELLTLLARFANNQSTDPIKEAIQQLYEDMKEDEKFRSWVEKVGRWARRILLEHGYILEKECNEDGVTLREEGRKFYDEKYKTHFDRLFDTSREWFKSLTTDPLNSHFGDDWTRLARDLLFDREGKRLVWKPELWDDLRRVIIPQVIDKVGYVPIPRMEYTDENVDLVIENLSFSGRNIFPNTMSVNAHNTFRFSPYATIPDESHHEVVLTLGQMQADLRDVLLYFNKKTGMARLRDSGIADILITGSGITVTVHLAFVPAPKEGEEVSRVFTVRHVRVRVRGLKFRIRESKHDAAYRMLSPIVTREMKKQIKKGVGDAVRGGLEKVDDALVRVRNAMKKEEKQEGEVGKSRTQALKEAFKRNKDEAREEHEGKHGQFKVVAKRDSALLPDQGHPQGWVNQQQEKMDSAKEGVEWRSNAFMIVPQPEGQAPQPEGQSSQPEARR